LLRIRGAASGLCPHVAGAAPARSAAATVGGRYSLPGPVPSSVMTSVLADLLANRGVLLADGATGTNYFQMGLTAGDAPELWNVDHPEKVQDLHRRFVAAGADIILTNTFGCNRHRLALHGAESRVRELAQRAAELARQVADDADHPVVVAGSVGPTGSRLAPQGDLTEADAIETFTEEIEGLAAGGADVAWIETMSAIDEVQAAANAAIAVGIPYVATCSFDTAGGTVTGLMPGDLTAIFDGLEPAPVAIGANCGVGAPDILVSLLAMTEHDPDTAFVSKGNCGIPEFRGAEIHYSGTPELMARYVRLAVSAGARIVGGCCGTSPDHLAAMREALNAALEDRALDGPAPRPSLNSIVENIGPLANPAPGPVAEPRARRRARRE
jgi:5-methyltetrahydrofolate--homocysteine methyltransferase